MAKLRLKVIKPRKFKLYCDACGCNLYYYVDGNNGAITNNSKGLCKNNKCLK